MRTHRITHLTALTALSAVAVLVLAACGGGGGSTATDTSSAPATTDTSSAPAATDAVALTAPANSATTGFAETAITAPADTRFTIHFVNDDPGIPHNVQIFEGTDNSGTPVFAPADDAIITGPAETDYEIPALAAGTYTYDCVVHATSMVGTLTVQ